jgi:16S rRNA (guanine527-N7)-methyltransferase
LSSRRAEAFGTNGGSTPELLDIFAEAQKAGFLGPGSLDPQLRHALEFAAIARRISPPASSEQPFRLADLGSGGGLPGLVVASEWADVTVDLIEANGRRAASLRVALNRLELGGETRVVEERAESCGRDETMRGTFDGVTARSFGRPAVVAECAAPLLKPGGWLLVSEPPNGEERQEMRWPDAPLRLLGLVPEELVHGEFEYQILRQAELCPDRFPRRVGVPTKRPLF